MTVIEAPTPVRTRREILLDAAAVIEEYGWATGGSGMPGHEDHKGSFCILGAIAWTLGFRDDSEETYTVANSVVSAEMSDVDTKLCEWNDNDAESQEHVTRTLRRLADDYSWEEAIAP